MSFASPFLSKRMQRDIMADAERIAAKKLGYNSVEERIADEMNKSSDGFWKGKALQTRLEPKELNITVDNSPEALLEAYERHKRGEIIEFDAPKIEAQDAEFIEVPAKETLWSRRVIHSTV